MTVLFVYMVEESSDSTVLVACIAKKSTNGILVHC